MLSHNDVGVGDLPSHAYVKEDQSAAAGDFHVGDSVCSHELLMKTTYRLNIKIEQVGMKKSRDFA